MSDQPSIFKILKNDFWAMIFASFPLIIWLLYTALWYFKKIPSRWGNEPLTFQKDGHGLLTFCVFGTIIGILFTWRRIRNLNQYFENGIEVTGIIEKISIIKDRIRITCSYQYSYQNYSSKTLVHKTKETKALTEGETVLLLLLKERPDKIILKNLFLS